MVDVHSREMRAGDGDLPRVPLAPAAPIEAAPYIARGGVLRGSVLQGPHAILLWAEDSPLDYLPGGVGAEVRAGYRAAMRRGQFRGQGRQNEGQHRRRTEVSHTWGVWALDGEATRAGRTAVALLDGCPLEQDHLSFLELLRYIRATDRLEGAFAQRMPSVPPNVLQLAARFLGGRATSAAGQRAVPLEPGPVYVPAGPAESDQFRAWVSRYDLTFWNDDERDFLFRLYEREHGPSPVGGFSYSGWSIAEWQQWALNQHIYRWERYVWLANERVDAVTDTSSDSGSAELHGYGGGAAFAGCSGAEAIALYCNGRRRRPTPFADRLVRAWTRIRLWWRHPGGAARILRRLVWLLKCLGAVGFCFAAGCYAAFNPTDAAIIVVLFLAAFALGCSMQA